MILKLAQWISARERPAHPTSVCLGRGSTLVLALIFSPASNAGGLWLQEYNQPTMGRATAGETTGSGDASDAWFNPAAMAGQRESQLMVGGGFVDLSAKFDVGLGSALNGSEQSGDAGDSIPSASVFYSRPYNDRLSFGLSGLALTGFELDYDDDWVGRFQAQEVSLFVIGVVPSLGYRLTDKLSVGFALPIMYSDLELEIGTPAALTPSGEEGRANISGDDVQVAASGSFLYRLSGTTRLGATLTSRFEFDYDGEIDSRYLGIIDVNTELTLAARLRVGLSHDFNGQLTGHLSWGWENWSEMEEVFISGENNGAALDRSWDDTQHYALGFDYRASARWTYRAGVSYDDSPVDADDRTADMPIDEQWRYAVGADYLRDNGAKVSASLVYTDLGDAEIDRGNLIPIAGFQGEYGTNEIVFVSFSYNW